MVELQVLSKIINTGSIDLIMKYDLTDEFFPLYADEYNFIKQHYEKYHSVPNKLTFLDKFKTFELVDVTESNEYLIDTIKEEHLYHKSVEVVNKVAELLQTNANDAVDYIRASLPSLSSENSSSGVTNIIDGFSERFNLLQDKVNAKDPWFITTGFEELDQVFNGWNKGEEFVVIFARTGQGKSWVLTKTLTHAWEIGCRVGYISPEMSPSKIGYRFDTLYKHFSQQNLVWGKNVDLKQYEEYGKQLQQRTNPFFVAVPQDFQKRITVTKLKQFCINNKLDILGIDGITYLTDERYRRGDNKATSLTNLSEDLMSLSLELQIPILVVVQSNRGGVKGEEDEGTPELENIRDSDGIAHNATKIISLRQKAEALELGIKKNRDGATGGKLTYTWNIDKGEFEYIPSEDDNTKRTTKQTPKHNIPKEAVDVF